MINPVLKKLGYSDSDRVFVLHADDIGMNYASVVAYAALLEHSPLSSAAIMVPCPWFPAASQLLQKQENHPKLDVGVHLTLTSEWDAYRWRPISTADPATGLLDDEGCFHRTTKAVREGAAVCAVTTELRAQIAQVQRVGIDYTHIDTHMGTLVHPRLYVSYMELGIELGVPAFGVRLTVERVMAAGYERAVAEKMAAYSQQLEARGMPLFNDNHLMPLHSEQSLAARLEYGKRVLDSAEPGLYYLIIHPCIDTPTLRALTPDWEARVGDYNLFMSDQWQRAIEASGVHVIGMKRLRELMTHSSV